MEERTFKSVTLGADCPGTALTDVEPKVETEVIFTCPGSE
jgi:hypothetical protein